MFSQTEKGYDWFWSGRYWYVRKINVPKSLNNKPHRIISGCGQTKALAMRDFLNSNM